MKPVNENIVEVEQGDTMATVVAWINENSDVDPRDLNPQEWTNYLYPGDLIIFNRPHAMYRLNATLGLQKGGDNTSEEPPTLSLDTREQYVQFIREHTFGGTVEIDNT